MSGIGLTKVNEKGCTRNELGICRRNDQHTEKKYPVEKPKKSKGQPTHSEKYASKQHWYRD